MSAGTSPALAVRRRAWAVAVTVSVLFHAAVLAFLVKDWTVRMPVFEDRTVTVSLDRPNRPPPPPPPTKAEREPMPPTPRREALARPVEAPVPPVIAPGQGQAPAVTAGSGDGRGRGGMVIEEAQGPVFRLPCVGQYLDRMSPVRRAECERYLAQPASGYRGKALPKQATAGPNLSPALKAEFKAAFEKRRENDPTAKTGPVIEDMTIEVIGRKF